jgi:hypothetical protein
LNKIKKELRTIQTLTSKEDITIGKEISKIEWIVDGKKNCKEKEIKKMN